MASRFLEEECGYELLVGRPSEALNCEDLVGVLVDVPLRCSSKLYHFVDRNVVCGGAAPC